MLPCALSGTARRQDQSRAVRGDAAFTGISPRCHAWLTLAGSKAPGKEVDEEDDPGPDRESREGADRGGDLALRVAAGSMRMETFKPVETWLNRE